MKGYWLEGLSVVAQVLLYYLWPMFAGPTDGIAMVLLILLGTLVLSGALGMGSGKKIKFLYPVLAGVLFLPSIPIYYHDSAWIHALWYFAASAFGIAAGSLIRYLFLTLQEKGRK